MNNSRSIYIAGPMTGYPQFNFPAFYAAEEKFRADGWVVFNPAWKDDEKNPEIGASETGDIKDANAAGFNFREAFTWDCSKIIEGDAIYMLPGWEKSVGASAEHAVALAMKKHYPEYEIIYG